MAPMAIDQLPQTTSSLVKSGIEHVIAKTAPSIAPQGACSSLQELDASKLIFTRNLNPKPVPAPNSPEVMTMSTYVVSSRPLTSKPSNDRASQQKANFFLVLGAPTT